MSRVSDPRWQWDALRYWLVQLPLSPFDDPACFDGPLPDAGRDGIPLDTVDNFAELTRRAHYKLRWNVAARMVEARYRRGPWVKMPTATGRNLILAKRTPYQPKLGGRV